MGGFIGVAEILVAHGDDYRRSGSPVGGYTALEAAAECGRIDAVSWLIGKVHIAIAELLQAALEPEDPYTILEPEQGPLLLFTASQNGQSGVEQILHYNPMAATAVQHTGAVEKG
ncbi:hypothetical protein CLAFUW4_06416 [Fulvia fulva]|uniref:Uncharacterized protein n=1 Tax=Passalora fulva TaxID=5499 RepID=A0A9Q8P9H3_PASFU|nr:uncharacterized protein CLAFUR5_06559 [Fulvia fulva]KAK4624456.1 hypothetical protein CLAFUR4_06419 [Fulvia fulva]KAK4624786.1 hypothetical protein CLAFUR0_06420 [Fulvia fulva]UJO18163.1 hypothetical protein CLAFUR5_06559 [Fulvia fulva]WPV14785.1 hypothetical protein CLAFUW4_06416 [Fulvia fulva]WPV30317.1 hypothetical protein CLAFUW7_06415 [Fulvia fulva]